MIALIWRILVGSCWKHEWELLREGPTVDRDGNRVGWYQHRRCLKCKKLVCEQK